MQILKLKSPTPEQLNRLRQLHNVVFTDSPWSERKFYDTFHSSGLKSICFVVEEGDIFGGFVLCKYFNGSRGDLNLTTLVVDNKYRGKGYAKMLIEALFDEFMNDPETKKIYLHFRSSKMLEGFYSRFNFKGLGIVGTYKNGEPKYRMEASREQVYSYLKNKNTNNHEF